MVSNTPRKRGLGKTKGFDSSSLRHLQIPPLSVLFYASVARKSGVPVLSHGDDRCGPQITSKAHR